MDNIILCTMTAPYHERNGILQATFDKQLVEVSKKLRRLEERYVLEEIDKDIFVRFKKEFSAERQQIAENAARSAKGVSNLEKCPKATLRYSGETRIHVGFQKLRGKTNASENAVPEGHKVQPGNRYL